MLYIIHIKTSVLYYFLCPLNEAMYFKYVDEIKRIEGNFQQNVQYVGNVGA
jgi:hypothetical protein